jgi:hypothetical protein
VTSPSPEPGYCRPIGQEAEHNRPERLILLAVDQELEQIVVAGLHRM